MGEPAGERRTIAWRLGAALGRRDYDLNKSYYWSRFPPGLAHPAARAAVFSDKVSAAARREASAVSSLPRRREA